MVSGGTGFSGPVFMTFFGNNLYVANYYDDSVTMCNWVSSNNTLSGCVKTGFGGQATSVATYPLSNGTTYLFVSVDNSIERCTITPGDGTLSGCTNTGVTASTWDLMVINSTLYVAGNLNNNVLSCPIDSMTGVLGTCTDTRVTPKGNNPLGLASSGDYLYITYYGSNNVYKCLLASLSTTVSSPCELTGADNLNGPYDLAFSDDGYVYITNYSNDNNGKAVTRCMVNGTTGDLGPCEVSSTLNLSSSAGIVFPPSQG